MRNLFLHTKPGLPSTGSITAISGVIFTKTVQCNTLYRMNCSCMKIISSLGKKKLSLFMHYFFFTTRILPTHTGIVLQLVMHKLTLRPHFLGDIHTDQGNCRNTEQRLFLHKIQLKQNSTDNKTVLFKNSFSPPPLSSMYLCMKVAHAEMIFFSPSTLIPPQPSFCCSN